MNPNDRSTPKALIPLLGLLFAVTVQPAFVGGAAEKKSTMSFAAVRKVVAAYFSELPDYRSGDLITHKSVGEVLKATAKEGWTPADRKQIEADVLKESDTLVRILSSKAGKQFMRKVAGYSLIYDRLDRVSRVKGGEKLLHDLVRLPDGHRYAHIKTPGGVPDLLALLPKNASGKKRSIKDYRKPTGRIYTQETLLKRLRESHANRGKKQTKK